MKRISRIVVSFAVLAIALSGFNFTRIQARDDSTIDVKVMTYNVDEGTDLGPLVAATSFNDLLNAVAFVYNEVQASNVPERSKGFAQKVEETLPDFIALQELSTWSTGPLAQPPATNVQIDQLQSILQALSEHGLSYSPIAISTNVDAEVPS